MAKASGQRNIVIEGTKELMDKFRALPLDIGRRTAEAFNQFAEQVIKESQPFVPYDPKRKTGTHLKDTAFIRKAESPKNPTAWLGYSAPHAFLVENDIAGRSKVGGSNPEHPSPGYSSPGTGAKYLARPFKQRQGDLEKKMEKILEEVCNNASS